MVTLIWHASKYKVHKLHQRYILKGMRYHWWMMYRWWSLCTFYLLAYQVHPPQIQNGCTSGGVYVPGVYTHAR